MVTSNQPDTPLFFNCLNTRFGYNSAIRDGTRIQKWYRSFSKDTKKGRSSFTRWDKVPPLMQGYGLKEAEFKEFVASYIAKEKPS